MPVKGLMPGLMEVGKIKIGIKGKEVESRDGNKFRLPQTIDYLRIVTMERDENDDYIIDGKILEIIKKNPATVFDKNKNVVGLPIRLLYNEIDLVFPTQYVSYVGGKLACSGDGVKAYTRDGRETKCACTRVDSAYTGKDKCKISGTLSCIIEGSNVGGCYKFRTTSINSVKYILSSLMLIKAATGGLLSFIPLRLVINPKKTIIPSTGASTTIYVVTVEFQGGIEELQTKALEMGRERVSLIENMRDIETEARNIVSPVADDARAEKEFAEEFFPETIEVETEKEAAATDEKPSTKKKAAAKKVTKKPLPEKTTKDDILGEVQDKSADVSDDAETAVTPSDPITREQLKIILDLKANVLKINNPEAWAALIVKMKFKGVEKANGMTVVQGNQFIEHLKSLKGNPT
jgi:hypothetical protein